MLLPCIKGFQGGLSVFKAGNKIHSCQPNLEPTWLGRATTHASLAKVLLRLRVLEEEQHDLEG